MSSGFMKPFVTIVGVQSCSLSLRRMVMLPSLAAAKPLLYRRRPISQICSFSLYSFILLSPCAVVSEFRADVPGVQDGAKVAIPGPFLGVDRGRPLAALAEGDQRAEARAE